jgi:hypothetical protein
MKFVYDGEYTSQFGSKQISMEIVSGGVYVTFERMDNSKKIFIRKPHMMRLDETYRTHPPYNGEGHYTTIGHLELHYKSYTDILTHLIAMPDSGKVLTLSDRIITIWDSGMEVQYTTRLCHDYLETIPIRFYMSRESLTSIEEIVDLPRYTIILNDSIPMNFTNEQEYNSAVQFLHDNLFIVHKGAGFDMYPVNP